MRNGNEKQQRQPSLAALCPADENQGREFVSNTVRSDSETDINGEESLVAPVRSETENSRVGNSVATVPS